MSEFYDVEVEIKSVQGNWVISTWRNGGYGGFQSAGVPVAMMAGPVTALRDHFRTRLDLARCGA